MKALLSKYKAFLTDKKKAWKSKVFFYRRRKKKKEYFRFYKVSNGEVIKNSLMFNIENFKVRNFRIFRKLGMAYFFRSFYKRSLFIKNYFMRFNYKRFFFFKGRKRGNIFDFFDNCDSLYNFSKLFNLSGKDKFFRRKGEIVMKSFKHVLSSNFLLESGKLENSFFFFFF